MNTYRYGDMHFSRHRVTEVIPQKKITWLTVDSRLNFVADKDEWANTSIDFEMEESEGQTTLRFTHRGLLPQLACYKDCSNAWTHYITVSLRDLIVTGEAQRG